MLSHLYRKYSLIQSAIEVLNALTKVGLKRSIKHEMGRRSATKIGGSSDYSMGIHSKNGTKNLFDVLYCSL